MDKDEVTAMKDFVTETMASLGCEMKWEGDADLKGYRHGEALLFHQLQAMKDGEVVWVFYQQYGESDPRINQPMRLKKTDIHRIWGLEDGSSFVAEFSGEGLQPDDQAFDECGGEGEMTLYQALPAGVVSEPEGELSEEELAQRLLEASVRMGDALGRWLIKLDLDFDPGKETIATVLQEMGELHKEIEPIAELAKRAGVVPRERTARAADAEALATIQTLQDGLEAYDEEMRDFLDEDSFAKSK